MKDTGIVKPNGNIRDNMIQDKDSYCGCNNLFWFACGGCSVLLILLFVKLFIL